MQIGITTFGSDGGKSGIGRYTANVLQQMVDFAPASFDIYGFRDDHHVFAPDTPKASRFSLSDSFRSPIANIAWHQMGLAPWCRRRELDVLFLPAGNRRLPIHAPCPTVGTIHDFSSLHVANKYSQGRMFYIKQVLPRLARRLTHVLTVSESSKRDIVEYAGVPEERVTVTPLAVNHQRYQRDAAAVAKRIKEELGRERPYLLYVSRIEHPGKNHLRLIEAFEHLKREYRIPHELVLAGSDWPGAEVVHKAAENSPLAEAIHFTGFVSDEELIDLYHGADALVFPSLYEGFGLPILEAMACGTPVVCADCSSLPEVAEDAAVYFSPESSESIAAAIHRLLEDESTRQQCVQRGLARSRQFTWERTARQTYEALQRAAAV